jgi:hypothetical protein
VTASLAWGVEIECRADRFVSARQLLLRRVVDPALISVKERTEEGGEKSSERCRYRECAAANAFGDGFGANGQAGT